ncbi:MAG: DUF3237 domain-containing protein [Deltaproteobacteria bacterium]|nr:DUF3237 domain-containing protein [Deltaproteobacteria bacterium]
MSDLKTEFLGEIYADLEEPLAVGETPHGTRMIYNIKGGTVKGPKINAEVLQGGADWIILRPDGVGELDVRATIRTDDDALIYVCYRGILSVTPEIMAKIQQGEAVDSTEYYFRTTPVFETASEKYAWLNKIIAVGVGTIIPNAVAYKVYTIL